LSWRRLLVLVRHLPADAACRRAIDPDNAAWGLAEQLLAAAVDALHTANWQRGGKGARPKRIPRPGTRPRSQTVGHVERSDEEVAEYLARFAPASS
jgi:hypothetical protein